MKHLEYDELFDLARSNASDEGFVDEQIIRMEHLKSCKECYESFCLLTMLEDEMGDINISEEYGSVYSPVTETVKMVKRTILATINVIYGNVQDFAEIVMKQLDKINEPLQFEPVLATTVRGTTGNTDAHITRLEELEDDRTFVSYNSVTNEVEIQLNIRKLETPNVIVVLSFEDFSSMTVSLEKKGNVLRGVASNIPIGNFVITIESE